MLDVWRIMNENFRKFIWRRLNPVRKQAMLDYFLVNDSLFHYVAETDIIAGYRSDHNGILLKLKLIENERGKVYRKFNNSLLKDNDYINIVKQTIREVKDTYKTNEYLPNTYITDENIQFNIKYQILF